MTSDSEGARVASDANTLRAYPRVRTHKPMLTSRMCNMISVSHTSCACARTDLHIIPRSGDEYAHCVSQVAGYIDWFRVSRSLDSGNAIERPTTRSTKRPQGPCKLLSGRRGASPALSRPEINASSSGENARHDVLTHCVIT